MAHEGGRMSEPMTPAQKRFVRLLILYFAVAIGLLAAMAALGYIGGWAGVAAQLGAMLVNAAFCAVVRRTLMGPRP